ILKVLASNPPLRQYAARCDAIRCAPCVTSFRRLSPPDALSRCADFVHQAVLQNFDLEQSSVETSQSRRNVVGHAEKATAQIAHLVSANTQSQHRKTKRAIFCQRSDRN